MVSIEMSPVQGKRHLDAKTREMKQAAQVAKDCQLRFLRSLKPQHPLYGSPEAQAARESTGIA